MKMTIEKTKTTTAKKKKITKKKKSSKRIKKYQSPTTTLRLPDGTPICAKVSVIFESSDLEMTHEEFTGFLSEEPLLYEDGIVISKSLDGFPWLEFKEREVFKIEFINPDSNNKVISLVPTDLNLKKND